MLAMVDESMLKRALTYMIGKKDLEKNHNEDESTPSGNYLRNYSRLRIGF